MDEAHTALVDLLMRDAPPVEHFLDEMHKSFRAAIGAAALFNLVSFATVGGR